MLNACFQKVVRQLGRRIAVTGLVATPVASAFLTAAALAQPPNPVLAADEAIAARNIGVSRATATKKPRKEQDQARRGGWPLYRTERGQEAYNTAMATLAATVGPPPAAKVFAGCEALDCPLKLPSFDSDGWLPSGRLWVSPSDYVIFVRSPRPGSKRFERRRSMRQMRYFIFHEFHNATRNTDVFDTISAHRGAVFVPFYMSKQRMDAMGRRFVTVVQVSPYNVRSIHATNLGSAGPGIEVAKNASDPLEPLQGKAGIVVASIVKAAAPHLRVVHHRGTEGLSLRKAYEEAAGRARERGPSARVTLPFAPAPAEQVATVSHDFDSLLWTGRSSSSLLASAGNWRRQLRPPVPRPSLTMPRAGVFPTATPILVGRPILVRQGTIAGLLAGPTLVEPVRQARQ